jgi:hypothetical protein
MDFALPQRRKLRDDLGTAGSEFLVHALNSVTRLLPHVETIGWRLGSSTSTEVKWGDATRREMLLCVDIPVGSGHSVSCTIRRLAVPSGVGAVPRTLHPREREICQSIINRIDECLKQAPGNDATWRALQTGFDEAVIAVHLREHHSLALNLHQVFQHLRELAEQTYENKALTFGCIINPDSDTEPDVGAAFPTDFFRWKKYRALSDGYYTAYEISRHGAIDAFEALEQKYESSGAAAYFPEWARGLAASATGSRIGIALTRHGDVLVLEHGSLSFTYRFGRWQYWNHRHLVDLLQASGRVQRVRPTSISRVARRIYRLALDVSFRRSGGLFVLLRSRRRLGDVVRAADQLDHERRGPIDSQFDQALGVLDVFNIDRPVLVELAALDGAVVIDNSGRLLSYAAVLEPRKRGRVDAAEGSRTKAAIGASNYGLAVKISSDGDITLYTKGTKFFSV